MVRNIALDKVNFIIREITSVRLAKGLSHEKLATIAKLDRSAISLIESGKRIPSILTLLKICEGLEVSLADILIKYDNTEGKE